MYSTRPETRTGFASLVLLIQMTIRMLIWGCGQEYDLNLFQSKTSKIVLLK